jgi:hypothetical protein
MGVATLEDLQGTIEVIVFPKVFELTESTWAEDAILVVSGRVDHKGEETVLLADSVWTWEQATAMGPADFATEVAKGDRGRRGAPQGAGTSGGRFNGNGNGNGYGGPPSEPVAVGPGVAKAGPRLIRSVPRVSPLRGGQVDGTVDVYWGTGGPVVAPTPVAALVAPSDTEEPQLPDEAVRDLVAREEVPTMPTSAGAGQSLHIRLMRGAQTDLGDVMTSLRQVIHEHPGETPVVLHVPAGPGRNQRMELRVRVAYDSELAALIGRLIGPGRVELDLAD